jgi:hypothetical protein
MTEHNYNLENMIYRPGMFRYFLPMTLNHPNYTDEFRKDLGQKFEETIITCSYNQLDCMNDWAWYFDSFYGSCYRFNTGKNELGQLVEDKRSNKGGKINGLQVSLYMDYFDGLNNYNSFSTILGAHVYINNKYVLPTMFEGYDLAANAENNVIMNRVISKKQPRPYSNCLLDIETHSKNILTEFFKANNKTYSKSECFLYCYQRTLVDTCNCYDNSVPNVTFGVLPCFSINEFFCNMLLFQTFFGEEAEKNCSAECPNYCESESYQVTINHSYLGSKLYYYDSVLKNAVLCKKEFNVTPKELQNMVLNGSLSLEQIEAKLKNKLFNVNFYYDDLSFTLITETPKYQLGDVVSNVGGLRKDSIFD